MFLLRPTITHAVLLVVHDILHNQIARLANRLPQRPLLGRLKHLARHQAGQPETVGVLVVVGAAGAKLFVEVGPVGRSLEQVVALDKGVQLLHRRGAREPANDAAGAAGLGHLDGQPHDVGVAGRRLGRDGRRAPLAPQLALARPLGGLLGVLAGAGLGLGGGLLGLALLAGALPVLGEGALVGRVLLATQVPCRLLDEALGAQALEVGRVLGHGGADAGQVRRRGHGPHEPLDDAHPRAALLGRQADEDGEGELGAVVLLADNVRLGVEDVAAPEDDVVGGIVQEGDDVGVQEDVVGKGGGVVVLGGHEDDEQELDLLLGEVLGLGKAPLEPGQRVAFVLFLKLPAEARGRVAGQQHLSAVCIPQAPGDGAVDDARPQGVGQEGEDVVEGPEQGREEPPAELEGHEEEADEPGGSVGGGGPRYDARGVLGAVGAGDAGGRGGEEALLEVLVAGGGAGEVSLLGGGLLCLCVCLGDGIGPLAVEELGDGDLLGRDGSVGCK